MGTDGCRGGGGARGKVGGVVARGRLVPFEIKYRAPEHTGLSDLKGLVGFCTEQGVETGYVITREVEDFGIIEVDRDGCQGALLKIPAPLLVIGWVDQNLSQAERRVWFQKGALRPGKIS